MRLNLAFILSIFLSVGLVTLAFTILQVSNEKARLKNNLESRVLQIAEDLRDEKVLFRKYRDPHKASVVIDSLSARYNLAGIAVYYSADSIVANPTGKQLIEKSPEYVFQALASNESFGTYVEADDHEFYQYIVPVYSSFSNLVLFYPSDYIDEILLRTIFRSLLRWFFQVIIISLIALLIIRYGIFTPINRIVEWTKAARSGRTEALESTPPAGFLAPLHNEIIRITRALQLAMSTAEEEAKLRTRGEAIWTPERLRVEVENLLFKRKMVVVSNREPYMHIHEGAGIKCIVPASGMITAMEPILKACGGLWIASGTGDADRETVDDKGKIQVPPEEPRYTLRRLWQTKEEEIHYYYGFSNEGLWPLCHIAHTRPVFRMEDWKYYKKVNEDFAAAVLEETANDSQPFILIQDYHFALLPQLIRAGKPDARIAIFWHIPWPNPESFGICPWQKEILKGMLGADLIGFHTQYHCNHYLETITNVLESRVGWDDFSVKMEGRTTYVKPFPISIEFTLKDYDDDTSPEKTASELLRQHGIPARYMGVGVDRIDYTKGIIEKFLTVERFIEKYPGYKGKFTFVQIGAPSRTFLKNYSDTMAEVENEAERINNRFRGKNWKPILLLKRHHSHEEIKPYYAAADFCMVSSLHDGMNLVAKEYVACRNNNTGSLILSQFTGASQELHGALIINPYDIEKSADTMKKALEMKPEEQNQRMIQMRQSILKNNIFAWASELIKTMASIRSSS